MADTDSDVQLPLNPAAMQSALTQMPAPAAAQAPPGTPASASAPMLPPTQQPVPQSNMPPPNVGESGQINFGSTDTQQPQKKGGPPNARDYQMPAIVTLFHQLLGDQAARGYVGGTGSPGEAGSQPARPVSRLDAFEGFLGTFLNSLSQGMARGGTGPGANMRGAGIAMQAPYERDLQAYQLQQQQRMQQAQLGTQQAQAQEAQARTGLYGAQATGAGLENQITQQQLDYMKQMRTGGGTDPVSQLGPLSADEKAILGAASMSPNPLKARNDAVEKIANMRAISGRMSGTTSIIPDNKSKTGFSKVIYDRTGRIISTQPDVVVPGMTGKVTQTQHIEKDADGNYVIVPETTTTQPIMPGAPAPRGGVPAAAPGAPQAAAPPPNNARPIMGANGQPLHQPLGAAPKQTLFQIDSALGLADRIRPDLEAVSKDIGRGGDLSDVAKVRAAWKQYQSLGIDPSNVDPDSVLSMMPNIDPRLAHLMPTIAMLQIVGASPYLRGMRNFNFVSQIQQHLPDPSKDSPQLMVSKLQQLNRNLPALEAALYKSEGITPTPDTAMLARYANLAGNNPDKMRVMLRQDGWNINAPK